MNNGTDRDLALQIVSLVEAINTNLASYNDTTYVPHIITQPTNFEGQLGNTASFTVIASNVKAYQWQHKIGNTWADSSLTGYKTKTLSASITEARLAYKYRCKITGKDDTIIYTDEVQMVLSENG